MLVDALKGDPEVPALESVICSTVLRSNSAAFAASLDPADAVDIVAKTTRKKPSESRARALEEFTVPADLAAAFEGWGEDRTLRRHARNGMARPELETQRT